MSAILPEGWRAAYEAWFSRARPVLERHEFRGTFSDYPRLEFEEMARATLSKPLSQARIALVSSGGLSLPGQEPFDAAQISGDASFRVISGQGPLTSWRVDHDHYDTQAAEEDYNTVFPLDALRALAEGGEIGPTPPRHFSFMGYLPDPGPLLENTLPAMASMMEEDGVDAALLVPV